MKRLEEAGLYGNGLVPVDTRKLVQRYNECLEAAGVTPTSLEKFRIDGVGWSPEVAAEKEDETYLSHGASNPLAVILTPDQRGKPVYISHFSFQRALMDQYFQRFARPISDLTAATGIWLDIDQGLSSYRSPLDLNLISDITVRTSAVGGVQEAWREQQRLVLEFGGPGEAWFRPSLRKAILESARAHGDLRERHFSIPEMIYSDTEVFYTKAFGGVYLFRGLASCEVMFIFEDESQMPERVDEGTRVYYVEDIGWLAILLSEGVLEVDLEWHAANPGRVHRTQECLLASIICEHDPEVNYGALTTAQKKGYIQRLGRDVPELYFELEVLIRKLSSSSQISREGLSLSVLSAVCHPRLKMSPLLRSLLWQLVTRLRPVDFWRVYRHNKELFYSLYPQWPESQKQWAIALVKDHIARRAED